MTRHTLTLPHGRELEWSITGPEAGPVLLHHHITPGSAEPQTAWARSAASRGLRMVMLARPGYGHSERNPGRSMADVARDSAAVLDALGVDAVFVSGSSGGAPYALACGALLRERVRGVAVHGCPAPSDQPDLDFASGMTPDAVECYAASLQGEEAVRAYCDAGRTGLLAACANPEMMRARRASFLPAVDAASLTSELAADVARGMLDGLARGADGWIDDELALARPWGYALESLAGVPVSLWHGTEDTTIPIAHGRWLAAHIPGVRAHLLDGEGHLSVAQRHLDEILDELVSAP
jgi:pimeloyl-ACP methyl ester carboxylesterase